MICDPVDPCLLYRLAYGSSTSADSALTTQADDLLFAGTPSFPKDEEAQAHRFSTKPFSTIGTEPVHELQFNGTFMSKISDGYKAFKTAYVEAIIERKDGTLADKCSSLRD